MNLQGKIHQRHNTLEPNGHGIEMLGKPHGGAGPSVGDDWDRRGTAKTRDGFRLVTSVILPYDDKPLPPPLPRPL